MALIEKLEAIGDAIRAKTGGTELLTLDAMPAEIESIQTGGGGAEIDFPVITDDCAYAFAGAYWKPVFEAFGDKMTSSVISKTENMFRNNTTTQIPFTINCRSDVTSFDASEMFYGCNFLTILPELNSTFAPSEIENIFYYCNRLRVIPNSWIEYFDNQNYANKTSIRLCNLCQSNWSLRQFPSELLKKIHCSTTGSLSSYYALYNNFMRDCTSIDEIVGIPVYGTATANLFLNFCYNCNRVKNIIFETNEDGTPKTASWKAQTIDLSSNIGYAYNGGYIVNYNSGITIDTQILTDETYEALKDNPDAWTMNYIWSRFNHDSAVNTINSLPDTSAFLAANGGTNTIKFKGAAGSYTDAGAINTLTEEEIAVATAKGWTVSLI